MNQEEKESPEKEEIERKELLNSRLWITVLLVLLVVFNLIMFAVYQFMYPSVSIWGQLWGYAESDTFKLITVTLFLPILMFLLDAIFEIRGAVQERIRKERDRQREHRWHCVELTSKAWNELYELCSQVGYFKKNANEDTRIEDILMKLRIYSNKTEDIVNMWSFRFTNLSLGDTGLFLEIINDLLMSAILVAKFIMDDGDSEEIAELQYTHGMVMRRLKSIGHHAILNILKLSIDVLDVSKPENVRESRTEEIRKSLDHLREWIGVLRKEKLKSDDYYSTIEGNKREALQNFSRKMEEWKRTHPKPYGFLDFPGFDDFRDLYLSVPREELISSSDIYHREYLKRLSNRIILWDECDYLEVRAGWER
ncbi:MAG: hypothetical protein ACXABY_03405 [Candidatus Thorarchaeota archaeon]